MNCTLGLYIYIQYALYFLVSSEHTVMLFYFHAMKMSLSLKLVLLPIVIETFIVTIAAQINLAQQGVAVQRSDYLNSPAHFAQAAIEGPANNRWNDGCSVTASGQTYAWWGLQLPAVAHMTNILIYYRENFAHHMDQFRLYLLNGTADQSSDSGLCYTDKGIPGYPDIIQNITCNMLAKNMYFVNRRKSADCFVELCYVAIYENKHEYIMQRPTQNRHTRLSPSLNAVNCENDVTYDGCWKGTWGTNCTTDCPDGCTSHHCFPQNGSCVWGCDKQRCFHGDCDPKTAICTKGCRPGLGGKYCTFYNTVYNITAIQFRYGLSLSASALNDGNTTSCISMSSTIYSSYMQIGNGSLFVITGVYLFFGDKNPPNGIHKVYCSNTTDSWADGTVLYNADYHYNDIGVFAVCKYIIYIPPIVYGNSKIDICEIEIDGCPYGKYGDSCHLTCSENCMGPCDLITGNCVFGCTSGWLGAKCDRACNAGKFGDQCLRDCSVKCISSFCDHVTGNCNSGCLTGWEGFNCTEECNKGTFGLNCTKTCNGCIVNECNHINGVCKIDSVCKPGYVYGKYCNEMCNDWHFGTNCNKMCNCLEKPCNIFTGECSDDGCKKGWKGESCDQECAYGYFGLNCAYRCETCFNQSCDIFEGNCRVGCNDGYRGRNCEMQVSAESLTLIKTSFFMGGFASMLGILLIILTVVIARRRIMKKQESRKGIDNSHSNSNEQHYDDIMKMESVSTYQDLAKQTVTVSSDYDQINNAYTNQ